MKFREATPADYPEVIRMITTLWDEMELPVISGPWEANAGAFLRAAQTADTARLLVVDHPEQSSMLIAVGMGTILQSAPTYWLPNGRMGYVQWFYTEPEYRRRGLASAILDDIVEWMKRHNVTRAQLHSEPEALPLYIRKGFEPTMYDNYWLRLD